MIYPVNLKDHPVQPLSYLFENEPSLNLQSPSSTSLSSLPLTSVIKLLQIDSPSAMFEVEEVTQTIYPSPLKYLGFIKDSKKKRLFRIYACESTPAFESADDIEVTADYRMIINEPFLCRFRLKWENPVSLLSEPDKFCKSCMITAQGGIGEDNIFESFYNDLEIINHFREDGKNFYNSTNCLTRLEQFLNKEFNLEQNISGDFNCFLTDNRIREEKVAAVTGFIARSTLDFTDKLWEVLKLSKDYIEMKESYLKVISFIRDKRHYPWVAEGNNTRLGSNLLRLKHLKSEDENVRHSILALCEDFSENIVDTCIELGIFKLKSDFHYFLVSGKVCSADQLLFLTRDNFRDMNKSIINLNKLYKILQMSILLNSAGIKVRTISKMMTPVLYFYQESDGFLLLTHEIKENFEVPNLKSFKLDSWEAVSREVDEDREVITRYLWIDEKWFVCVEEVFAFRDNNLL
jgi:hypothetical protein